MDPLVPLVIPEVNPDHLALIDAQRDAGRDGFIVTNPNCSTIVMCLSLAPLRQFKWTDVRVATMQAISGAGFQGVPAMSICDNVIPYIGSEEQKMETEPLKIMGSSRESLSDLHHSGSVRVVTGCRSWMGIPWQSGST